ARFSFEESNGEVSFGNSKATTNPAQCLPPLNCPTAGVSGVRFSNAVAFTGSKTLKLKNSVTVQSTKPFSAAAWVYSNSSIDSILIAARLATSLTADKFRLGLNADGAPYCQFGTAIIATVDVLPSNTWTNLICSIDTTKKMVLYVNGAPVANGVAIANPNGALTVWIGADGTGTIINSYFDGSIDEVSIFNRFATWEIAEVMYDQYAAAGRRSPTRSYTATATRTSTKTSTPSRTGTQTVAPSPIPCGAYPYPAPICPPSITLTSTRSKTKTAVPSTTRSVTPRPVYYPYP
ncbi:MAG: LamG domain-containing protein, partial [Chloroflexales bacterium]|nr:LamG domain-containing protein [Chloroflexales bacterium]